MGLEKWKRHRWAAVSLLAALAVLVGFKLLGVLVYDTNDDALMAGLSYGYYGAPEGKLIYINPILGELLAWLQSRVPALPWYYLVELGLMAVTMAVYYYLVLDRQGKRGLPAVVLLTLVFAIALLTRVQYTKIAGAASGAGVLLMLHCVRERKSWYTGLLGGLLALAGFLLRADAFFMVLIPLFGVGATLLWELLRKKECRRALGLCGAFLVLFALCGGGMLVQKRAYSSPDWQQYLRYNDLRTELLDYGFPDYGENQALYESLHISQEDLKLFQSWDFGDPEVFDLDAMEALCNAKAEKNASLGELGRGIRSAIRGLLSYDFAGVLLLSLLALFVSDRSGGLQGLYALLAVVAVETAMLYHGRGLRERVDVPLMLTAAAVQLTVGIDPEKLKQKQTRWGAAFLAAALVLSQVPNLIARKDDAMERYVGASHLHGAYQVLSGDKGRLYLTRTDELPADRMPGKQGGFGYLSNIGTLGGWLTQSPYVNARYESYGVENPFRDLVDRGDLRLMSQDVEPVLGYIQRHYAAGARAVPVRMVNGEYPVYRILTGEPRIPELPEGDPESLTWTLETAEGILRGTAWAAGENSFAADIYLTLTDGAGEETTLCVLQSPQAGAAMDQGRYGAFETTEEIAPGRYRVTLTVAGEKRYQVDAGEIEI